MDKSASSHELLCSFCDSILNDPDLHAAILRNSNLSHRTHSSVYSTKREFDASRCLENRYTCWTCCRLSCEILRGYVSAGEVVSQTPESLYHVLSVDLRLSETFLTLWLELESAASRLTRLSLRVVDSRWTHVEGYSYYKSDLQHEIYGAYLQDKLQPGGQHGAQRVKCWPRPIRVGPGYHPDPTEDTTTAFARPLSPAVHGRIEYIRDWLNECSSTHEACVPRFHAPQCRDSPSNLPTRLINVKAWPRTPCLVETDGLPADKTKYATLSHKWGESLFQTLTRANYGMFRSGIDASRLPQTFWDVVALCQWLEIQYVWIDSLCIIQDSPQDWASESANMHQVYGNSFLNIVAAASDGPTQGLYRPKLSMISTSISIEVSEGTLLVGQGLDDHGIESTLRRNHNLQPVFERGWILQECFLSPRILYWDDAQIVLKCESGWEGEMKPSVPQQMLTTRRYFFGTPLAGITAKGLDELWRSVAEDYSLSKLTKERDRVFALSGLAAFMHDLYSRAGTATRYLSGLWEHDLVRGLGWICTRRYAEKPEKFAPSEGPSWSWIDKSGVFWDKTLRGHRDRGQCANALEIEPRVVGLEVVHGDPANEYGEPTRALLMIRTATFDIYSGKLEQFRRGRTLISAEERLRYLSEVDVAVNFGPWPVTEEDLEDYCGVEILCMLLEGIFDEEKLHTGWGLIIVHAGHEDGRKLYRRVGYILLDMHVDPIYSDWTIQQKDLTWQSIALI